MERRLSLKEEEATYMYIYMYMEYSVLFSRCAHVWCVHSRIGAIK